MLKKTAYAVITSGVFFAPLTTFAMPGDSPFPPCIGSDCTIVSHDDIQRNTVSAVGESVRQENGGSSSTEHRASSTAQKRPGTGAFPEDNSND